MTQWNAFSSDCDLTFKNKDPDHILEQIEKIHLMDIETALLCFNALKFSIVDFSISTKDPSRNPLYENHREENMERIQYLMSLLSEDIDKLDGIKPEAHPILLSMEDASLILVTLSKINQTQFVLNRSATSENKSSHLREQVRKLQPQLQTLPLQNPHFNIPTPNILIETKPNAEVATEPETLDSDLKTLQESRNRSEQQPVWTETLHIEFPSAIVCRKSSDQLTEALSKLVKQSESELVDFVNNHTEIERIYIDIMKWFDLINNQDEQNLPNSHPLFNWVTYTTQLNQVPEFLLNDMTSEQQKNFTSMRDLIRRYSWELNLYFEYRRCIPKIFREHVFLSYTVPVPFTTEENFTHNNLSDISILYEFSANTPSFLSSFKRSYPIRILQQTNLNEESFTSNDLRNRYESHQNEKNKGELVSKWNATLKFLEDFISRNRRYLHVSF